MPSSAGQTCALDRKSTRLNSSHTLISYAVFCLKKQTPTRRPAPKCSKTPHTTRRCSPAASPEEATPNVLYDASHAAGLLAAGCFLFFLSEGAPAKTFSSSKPYGGPP